MVEKNITQNMPMKGLRSLAKSLIVSIVLMCLCVSALSEFFGMGMVTPAHGKSSAKVEGRHHSYGPTILSQAQDYQDYDVTRPEIKCAKQLDGLFKEMGYNSDPTLCEKRGVPCIVLNKLPSNMGKCLPVTKKKETFLKTVLPIILMANDEVRAERTKLLKLNKKTECTEEETLWLMALSKKYRLKKFDLEELTLRVDEVPVGMALTQTAIETGWGASYAARSKNALFGTTLRSGVKAYQTLESSTRAYLLNLNTNPAYRDMRLLRQCMNKEKRPLDSYELLGTLVHYCEYKNWYVNHVRNMMRHNQLEDYDKVVLELTSATGKDREKGKSFSLEETLKPTVI